MSSKKQITTRVFDVARDMALSGYPEVVLAGDQLPLSQHFDAWCAILDGVFDYRLRDKDGEHAPFRGAWLQLAEGVVFEARYDAMQFRNTLAQTRSLSRNYCLIYMLKTGFTQGLIDGEPFVVAPGSIHLLDMSRAYLGRVDDLHQVGIMLPYQYLGYDPYRHSARLNLSLSEPEGFVLASAIEALVTSSVGARPDAQTRLMEGFGGLVRSLMLRMPQDETKAGVEAARAQALRRYVDDHLLEKDLTAARIGAAVGASRATVYRVFGNEGGVEAAIRKRKLRGAAQELCLAAPKRGIVRQISERYGFEDTNQFSRSFRRDLGYAPKDIIGLGQEGLNHNLKSRSDRGRIETESTLGKLLS